MTTPRWFEPTQPDPAPETPSPGSVDAASALTREQLAMIALVLNVRADDLQGIATDQLLAWLQDPPSEDELARRLHPSPPQTAVPAPVLTAASAPVPAPPEARASLPIGIPREMLVTIARTLNVPVRELEGASPDLLLAWLDAPELFEQARRNRPAPEDAPVSTADGLASIQEGYRSVRRQTTPTPPSGPAPWASMLSPKTGAEAGGEPRKAGGEEPVPPRAGRSTRLQDMPDLMLLRNARALKGTPPRASLLKALRERVSRLFQRSSGRGKKPRSS